MEITAQLYDVWEKLQKHLKHYSVSLVALGFVLITLGWCLGWVLFPKYLDKTVRNEVTLAPGKTARKRWTEMPEMNFNIYLFNISNPSEVMQGAKPALQEIGPYCFKMLKKKLNLSEDPKTDTITYSLRTTWHQNQQAPSCPSPHLTGLEELVVPHVPMMSILLIAEKDYPSVALTMVNKALPHIFGNVRDIFLRATANELLFGGVLIDCSTSDVLGQMVCGSLENNAKGLTKLGNDKYVFSFFGPKNGSTAGYRYTVKRGVQDSAQVGKLVAVNNKTELQFWRGDCNRLQGTDGTIFPPFRPKGDFTVYSSEVCRVLHGIYEGIYNYKGVTGYKFSITLGHPQLHPGDRCYCPADNRCYKGGVLDAFKCQGAPLVASLPHFYEANSHYEEAVIGMSPVKDKHGIFVVLEPISGAPLMVRKRVQLNIDLKEIPFISATAGLHRTLVPILWAEESLDLDMSDLETVLFLPMRVARFVSWLCFAVGTLLISAVVLVRLSTRSVNRVQADCSTNNHHNLQQADKY